MMARSPGSMTPGYSDLTLSGSGRGEGEGQSGLEILDAAKRLGGRTSIETVELSGLKVPA